MSSAHINIKNPNSGAARAAGMLGVTQIPAPAPAPAPRIQVTAGALAHPTDVFHCVLSKLELNVNIVKKRKELADAIRSCNGAGAGAGAVRNPFLQGIITTVENLFILNQNKFPSLKQEFTKYIQANAVGKGKFENRKLLLENYGKFVKELKESQEKLISIKPIIDKFNEFNIDNPFCIENLEQYCVLSGYIESFESFQKYQKSIKDCFSIRFAAEKHPAMLKCILENYASYVENPDTWLSPLDIPVIALHLKVSVKHSLYFYDNDVHVDYKDCGVEKSPRAEINICYVVRKQFSISCIRFIEKESGLHLLSAIKFLPDYDIKIIENYLVGRKWEHIELLEKDNKILGKILENLKNDAEQSDQLLEKIIEHSNNLIPWKINSVKDIFYSPVWKGLEFLKQILNRKSDYNNLFNINHKVIVDELLKFCKECIPDMQNFIRESIKMQEADLALSECYDYLKQSKEQTKNQSYELFSKFLSLTLCYRNEEYLKTIKYYIRLPLFENPNENINTKGTILRTMQVIGECIYELSKDPKFVHGSGVNFLKKIRDIITHSEDDEEFELYKERLKEVLEEKHHVDIWKLLLKIIAQDFQELYASCSTIEKQLVAFKKSMEKQQWVIVNKIAADTEINKNVCKNFDLFLKKMEEQQKQKKEIEKDSCGSELKKVEYVLQMLNDIKHNVDLTSRAKKENNEGALYVHELCVTRVGQLGKKLIKNILIKDNKNLIRILNYLADSRDKLVHHPFERDDNSLYDFESDIFCQSLEISLVFCQKKREILKLFIDWAEIKKKIEKLNEKEKFYYYFADLKTLQTNLKKTKEEIDKLFVDFDNLIKKNEQEMLTKMGGLKLDRETLKLKEELSVAYKDFFDNTEKDFRLLQESFAEMEKKILDEFMKSEQRNNFSKFGKLN